MIETNAIIEAVGHHAGFFGISEGEGGWVIYVDGYRAIQEHLTKADVADIVDTNLAEAGIDPEDVPYTLQYLYGKSPSEIAAERIDRLAGIIGAWVVDAEQDGEVRTVLHVAYDATEIDQEGFKNIVLHEVGHVNKMLDENLNIVAKGLPFMPCM